MKIEINPRSLLNLEHICEVLYKLHPSVLDYLVDIQRSLGSVLGWNDINNLSMEEREFIANIFDNDENVYDKKVYDTDKYSSLIYEDLLKTKDLTSLTEEDKTELVFSTKKDKYRDHIFHNLRRYIQLDTYEYIPIKIFVEVEDPIIGKKVRELIRALETTREPEQFYLNKKELDEDAYFAEGYGLTMNDEQRREFEKIFWGNDVETLKAILKKEKLYP